MKIKTGYFFTVLLVFQMVFGLGMAFAGEKQKNEGWELNSAYNKLYKNSERDRLKGRVLKTKEVVPLPGMAPGIAIIVKDSDGDHVEVHLAPKWFVEKYPTGLRKGDKVKVKGVWAEIDGKDIFMAAKVKKSEFVEYKVRRTKDGYPFWAMSEQDLKKELSGK